MYDLLLLLLGRSIVSDSLWSTELRLLAPLISGISQTGYWSGITYFFCRDLTYLGSAWSPAWQWILYYWATRSAQVWFKFHFIFICFQFEGFYLSFFFNVEWTDDIRVKPITVDSDISLPALDPGISFPYLYWFLAWFQCWFGQNN